MSGNEKTIKVSSGVKHAESGCVEVSFTNKKGKAKSFICGEGRLKELFGLRSAGSGVGHIPGTTDFKLGPSKKTY